MSLDSQRVNQLPERFNARDLATPEQTLKTMNTMLLMIKALQRDLKRMDRS